MSQLINLTNTGAGIKLELNYKYPIASSKQTFYEPIASHMERILRFQNLEDSLYETVQAIRREAYNQGWKDAKSHRARKETWFSGVI